MNNTKSFNYVWSFKDLFVLLGSFVIITLVTVPLDYISFKIIKGNPDRAPLVIISIFLLLLYIYLKRKGIDWSSLKFTKKRILPAIIAGILSGIGIFVLIDLIFYVQSFNEMLNRITVGNIYIILFILPFSLVAVNSVLLSPVVEEIFSRGILFQIMERKYNTLFTIIIVALVDSLTHISSYSNFTWMLIRMIGSLCITYLFYKYRNIFASISCHCTLNYLTLAKSLLLHKVMN